MQACTYVYLYYVLWVTYTTGVFNRENMQGKQNKILYVCCVCMLLEIYIYKIGWFIID